MLGQLGQISLILAGVRQTAILITHENEELRKRYSQLLNEYELCKSEYDKLKNEYDKYKANTEKSTQEVSNDESR